MTAATKPADRRFTVPDYLDWLERKAPPGRYELADGVAVAMAPERAAHVQVKAEVWQALREAIRHGNAPCQAFADGMTVQVDDTTAYEPDATVNCGDPVPRDAVILPNPVIVVEVPSPGTRSRDTGQKLADYFRVPSIRHYLIVDADEPLVIHHRRTEDGRIETAIIRAGALTLDPPGLTIPIERFYE
ncbi:MAG: Uma2 family endonuclease [Alphaproteobacteria bacterium]|jgi:Uma2 family endonuclease|nr:Uma2 family endonuclease [Alphaproteobacteria bacterium]